MKHEPRDESHSFRACAELVSAGGPEARWEDGSEGGKEETERMKTRAEIRRGKGRREGKRRRTTGEGERL